MRHSMAAWIPGSGEGRSPSPFRFAVRSGCLRQRLARTAYTNILTLPNDLSPSWLIARERTSAPPVHALARPPAHNLQPSSSRHERHSLRYMQSQPRRCTAPQKTHLARLGNPPTTSAKQPVISYQAVQPNDQDYPLYTEP